MDILLKINQTLTIIVVSMLIFESMWFSNKDTPELYAYTGGIIALSCGALWVIYTLISIWH